MWSRKIEHFSFSMFYYKTKLCEKKRDDIVATKKVCIWMRNKFVLWDKETIIDKGNDRNRNF